MTESVQRFSGALSGALDQLIGNAISRKRQQERQKRWAAILAPYERPDHRRSMLQLTFTLALHGAMWAVLLWSVEVGYWLTAIFAVPAGGLMVRLIVIQHDCIHGSYFTSRGACSAVGRGLAVLTLAPYDHVRKVHMGHHAHSGNLDRHVGGDIPTLTVAEYGARARWSRLRYRLIRNPIVNMSILVPMQLLVVNRFPWHTSRSWKREWRSVWWTNAALAAVLVGTWLAFGVERLAQIAIIQCMITLYGGAFAGWINHTQHQFEHAYWRRSGKWNFIDAGLRGSSWLALPKPLQWLIASIGLHHVHHLSTRIPNYRLQRCHDDNPALRRAHRITLRDGLKALNLALWDEQREKLISFGEYRRLLKQ